MLKNKYVYLEIAGCGVGAKLYSIQSEFLRTRCKTIRAVEGSCISQAIWFVLFVYMSSPFTAKEWMYKNSSVVFQLE